MRSIYINARTSQGKETIDEVEPHPEYWPTRRAMMREAVRCVQEYRLAGFDAYVSSRPCANWKA